MKKLSVLCLSVLFNFKMNSQNWQLGGNTAPVLTNVNNTFGSAAGVTNNIPVRFITNGTERFRMHANQTSITTVAVSTFLGGNQNTSGFIGIGTQDPWSRLHIGIPTGSVGTSAPYGGYRDWMGEGLTVQRADDQLWMGHIQWGPNVDQQNAVINWGDDQAGASGPDHMVFNYTSSTFSGPYAANGINPAANTRFGLEIMRLTDDGLVGIGPRFDNVNRPQSRLCRYS